MHGNGPGGTCLPHHGHLLGGHRGPRGHLSAGTGWIRVRGRSLFSQVAVV